MFSCCSMAIVFLTSFEIGGGGGKGTWGKNGQIYEEESQHPDDPNYDSETEKVIDIKCAREFLYL